MLIDPPSSLSPSSLSSFTNCPLSFRFAYIDRLPQAPSVAASKGTLVHRALEHLMTRPPASRTLEAALGDLTLAVADLEQHPDFTGLDLDADALGAFHRDSAELVRKYFDLEDPAQVHPIGLELKLEAQMGGARVRGIIDRLERDAEGNLVVTDYKTGAVPRSGFENARMAGVHIYSALCESAFGQRPARIQLLYLSGPTAIVATPSPQSAAATERRTSAIWTAVERACEHDDFRPNPNRLCEWCSFQAFCPAFGGDPSLARGAARVPAGQAP